MNKAGNFWLRPCPECGDMEPVVYTEGNAKKIYHEDGSTEMFFTDVSGSICECTCCGAQTEPGVEQCPTAIFNLCQLCETNQDFVPETLTWCRSHYVPPVQKYITCKDFGYTDGMNGGCWWCMEMTPYQWHMCQDASWMRSLTNQLRTKVYTKAEAIEFIEHRKQTYPMGNERRALLSESET